MKVLEHGNKFVHETYICRCKSCRCLFNFFLRETKKVDVRDGRTEWHIDYWVECPECGYENVFREEELIKEGERI